MTFHLLLLFLGHGESDFGGTATYPSHLRESHTGKDHRGWFTGALLITTYLASFGHEGAHLFPFA